MLGFFFFFFRLHRLNGKRRARAVKHARCGDMSRCIPYFSLSLSLVFFLVVSDTKCVSKEELISTLRLVHCNSIGQSSE